MNKITKGKISKSLDFTDEISKQVKAVNKELETKFIYLTNEDNGYMNFRKYIRGFAEMQLDELVDEIVTFVTPMKIEIKFKLIDIALEEYKVIDKALTYDTSKHIYIKKTAIEGIEVLYGTKLSELGIEIRKQIELITDCNVEWEFFRKREDGKRIMSFYILIDDENCRSETEYKQFNIQYKNNISIEEYVDYIVKALNNGLACYHCKICNNTIIINKFIENELFSKFHINQIEGTIYFENEIIFLVHDDCIVELSVENSTLCIKDEDYCNLFIDLKNDSYTKEELV